MGNERKKVHPVDELLPKGQMFVYGLQHVLAMYAGAVAVPLIIAGALGLSKEQLIYLINADLFTAGIATILQSLGFLNMGVRSPIIQGVSFAAVTPMIIIGKTHGITGIYGATIAAGIFAYLIAPYFSRLIRFFPPLVTGSVITIIGVSLMPVAVNWAGGGAAALPGFGSLRNIGMALVVLILVLIFNRFLKGFYGNIAVLLGLAAGTLLAVPLGMTDFSKVAAASWIQLVRPFAFGWPKFEIVSIISMIIVMLVIMTETTGDIIAIGEIIGKPTTEEDLARGMRADGFSTILGGIMNTFPYSAFAQNVGLIGLTGVKSRFVVTCAGVILCILGLFPKMASIVAAVPNPVLGGAGIAMFGMVAASGIRTLSRVKFEGTGNAMVVAVSLGVGLIPLASPTFYNHFPVWAQVILHSGITATAITALLLNIFFNELGGKKKPTTVAEGKSKT